MRRVVCQWKTTFTWDGAEQLRNGSLRVRHDSSLGSGEGLDCHGMISGSFQWMRVSERIYVGGHISSILSEFEFAIGWLEVRWFTLFGFGGSYERE